MKRFVIGDIHGMPGALKQCLDRSGFNKEKDTLICLGDVCDRGLHVRESIEELLSIKNLIFVMGNHDMWFLDWAKDKTYDPAWFDYGGRQTLESYHPNPIPKSHIDLLDNAHDYYLTDDNKLFVHAGINPEFTLENQTEEDLFWDRNLVFKALSVLYDPSIHNITGFDEVYIGHTPTTSLNGHYSDVPLQIKEIWMMDTGAGMGDKLTIMDIDTKEYWQSDAIVRGNKYL